MSQRAFNNCVLNGVIIAIGEMISGSGLLDSIGYDQAWTTLNHCIHNVRLGLLNNATFQLFGDRTSLTSQARTVDTDNFGGTHTFKYDDTEIEEFDGLVTAEYDDERRLTTIIIRGEEHGT